MSEHRTVKIEGDVSTTGRFAIGFFLFLIWVRLGAIVDVLKVLVDRSTE